MKPTNPATRAWAMLSGTRLTAFCLGLLIALCLASEAAQAWLEWRGAFVEPAVGQWLHQWVIADSEFAPGFISVLGLLFLNLLCATLAGSKATQEAGDDLLTSGLESKLSSDAFGDLARRWARENLGRVSKVEKRPDGTKSLSVRRGRPSSWFKRIAHWALVGAAVGGGLMATRGFQARTIVEEGAKVRAVEHVRGPVPASWKAAEARRAEENEGAYFDPGFEIERAPADTSASIGSSRLHIYRDSRLISSITLSPGRPMRFEDLTLHLLRYVPGSTRSVSLTVTDRASGSTRRFSALGSNQSVDLEDFGFRVTEIRPETDESGLAVELEYHEGTQPAQRFWIFEDHPDYDFAHRKKSAQHFTLLAVRGRTAAEIVIGREPGAGLLWGGLVLAAALFWLALARPEERFWIKWSKKEGAPLNIELLGWSARPLPFSTRFYLLAGQFESYLTESENKSEADDAVART